MPQSPQATAKAVLSVFSAAILFVGGTTTLRAQFALDEFDPNADGVITAIAVQPDGKILIGGLFSMVSPNGGPPVSRNNIVRLNPDGCVNGFVPGLDQWRFRFGPTVSGSGHTTDINGASMTKRAYRLK